MGDTLAISRSLRDEIVALAASSIDEICGLLFPRELYPREGGGPDWTPAFAGVQEAASILPCANVHPEPASNFEIDPATLIAAHRAVRSGGPPILGHYHSHPSGSAIPSATDAAAAPPDGAIWLIIAQGDIAAWRAVRDGAVHGRFDPVALIETPPCA